MTLCSSSSHFLKTLNTNNLASVITQKPVEISDRFVPVATVVTFELKILPCWIEKSLLDSCYLCSALGHWKNDACDIKEFPAKTIFKIFGAKFFAATQDNK
jgi:hypothetical protein